MSLAFPDPLLKRHDQPPVVLATLTLYGEARGEPTLGKRAVLWVVRNRMEHAIQWKAAHGKDHPIFGDGTIAGVVLAPWQFSCWNPHDPNSVVLDAIIAAAARNLPDPVWPTLSAIAEGVLAAESGDDPTLGATHYCTMNLWGREGRDHWFESVPIANKRTVETFRVGNHVFAKAA